jgi:hypothetical protein
LKRAHSTSAVLAFIGSTWMLAAPAAARHDSAEPIEKTAASAACGVEDLLAGKKPTFSLHVRGDLGLLTDGAVAPEGAQWDSPVVVTLETDASFVTYDLGQPHPISAVMLQADANDTYKILGSSDGTPSSFKVLAEIQNVVDRVGHGLRTRAVEIPPTTVRYLRVGEANGDGFYSIAELATYCKKPSPFPPAMRIVDAPPAQVGEAPPAGSGGPRPKHDGGSVFILAAAAAALAWLAYRTVRR